MARKKVPHFTLHAMTKGGAVTLFNFYKRTHGVELVSEPVQVSEGQWKVVMTHPFPEEVE